MAEPTTSATPSPMLFHIFFMLMVPVYILVHYFALHPGEVRLETFTWLVFGILSMASIGSIGLALLAPRLMPTLRPEAGDSAANRRRKLTMATIIQSACLEAIAIYGLIGAFVQLAPWMSYGLMLASLLAFAAFTPRVRAWADEAARLT